MKLTGIAAAPGYAVARALVWQDVQSSITRISLLEEEVDAEITRFSASVQVAIEQVQTIKEETKRKVGPAQAEIFESHIFMLQDEEFTAPVIEKIRDEKVNAEVALEECSQDLITLFENMEHDYMRERAADFRDLTQRILKILMGQEPMILSQFSEPIVLIAHDLPPSFSAQLDHDQVAGIVTNIGGKTSHSSILARSLEIPAVVGISNITHLVQTGDLIIVDGVSGQVFLHPTPFEVDEYNQNIRLEKQRKLELERFLNLPSATKDGQVVGLVANIGTLDQAEKAKERGAEGIGLFRTEFLYMERSSFPSEEEQFEAYKRVAEIFGPQAPIVIRTLDIGGDKSLPYWDLPKEENPFLGYRAIRLCLQEPEIFKVQLRAILRASAFGNLKIMFPMISNLTELRRAKEILMAVQADLRQCRIDFNGQIEVGMMVEIPSVVFMIDHFAKEVDFFSIGTNDLIQYLFAADRMNEKVSYLTQFLDPTVLQVLARVIQSAHAHGKWAGMCGEMAAHPLAIPILLGLGLQEFSMSASSILTSKELFSQIDISSAKMLAQRALSLETAEQVEKLMKDSYHVLTR